MFLALLIRSNKFSSSSVDSVRISSSGMNSDTHASAEYRANMVKGFAKKAVEAKFSENQALPVFKVPLF